MRQRQLFRLPFFSSLFHRYFVVMKCFFLELCFFVPKLKVMKEIINSFLQFVEQSINTKVAEGLQAAGVRGYVLEKKMLSIDDVSVLTGLSKSHLYKMTCSHQIPYYKPNGKLMYFDKAEIEEWMRQNRIETTDEAEQRALSYVIEKGGMK